MDVSVIAWNNRMEIKPFVLIFGQILGETRDNLMPEGEIIKGDMKAISNKLPEDTEDNTERLVKDLTLAYGPAAGTLHSTFPVGIKGLSLVDGHTRLIGFSSPPVSSNFSSIPPQPHCQARQVGSS